MAQTAARSRSVGAVIVIAVVACLPIVPGLDNGYWRGETDTATVAVRTWGQLFDLLPHAHGGSAGYALLMHAWADVFGADEVSLRVPSLVAVFGTVVVVGVLAGRMGRRWSGPAAAATVALQPFFIPFYGMEARGFASCAFFVAVAALAAHRASHGEGRAAVAVFAVASTLAISMNVVGVLAILSFLPWIPRSTGGERRRLLWLVLPLATAAGMSIMAAHDVALQTWLTRPSAHDGLVAATHLLTPGIAVFAIALTVAALLARRAGGKAEQGRADDRFMLARATRDDIVVLSVWGVGPGLFLTLYSWLVSPLSLEPGALSSVLAFAILVGIALDAVVAMCASTDRTPARGVTAPYVALAVGATAMVAASVAAGALRPAPKAEDLRAATAYLVAHRKPADAVLFSPSWAQHDLQWYLGDHPLGTTPLDVAAVPGRFAADTNSLFEPTLTPSTIRRDLRPVDRVWVIGYETTRHPAPDPGIRIIDEIRLCWNNLYDQPIGRDMELQLWQRAPGQPVTLVCAT
jgi:mannosyltransferase